jgi:hypothetical protein
MWEEWLKIDNEIDILKNRLASLKEQKETIFKRIINESKSKYESKKSSVLYETQNHVLKLVNVNNYSSLTFSFLENCLLKMMPDNKDKVGKMIQMIKQQRTIHTSQEIKKFSKREN